MSEELVYEPEKAVLDDVRQQPMYDPGLERMLRNAGDKTAFTKDCAHLPAALMLAEDEFYFECHNTHHAIISGRATLNEVGRQYRELVDRANYLPKQFAGRWNARDLEIRAAGAIRHAGNTILDAWITWRIPEKFSDDSPNWASYVSGLHSEAATTTDLVTTLENALLAPAPDYNKMKLPDTRQKFPKPLSALQRSELVSYAGRLTLLASAGTLGYFVPPRNDVELAGVVLASIATSMWGVLIAKAYCNSKPFPDQVAGEEQNRDDAERGQTRDEVKNTENKPYNGEETTACYFSPI